MTSIYPKNLTLDPILFGEGDLGELGEKQFKLGLSELSWVMKVKISSLY